MMSHSLLKDPMAVTHRTATFTGNRVTFRVRVIKLMQEERGHISMCTTVLMVQWHKEQKVLPGNDL